MNKDKGIAESDDGSVPKEKEKEKDSKERDKGKKPLSIPAYTKEQLLTYTNAQIQTIKDRAELKDIADLALMCLEALEEKKLLDPSSTTEKKRSKAKKIDGIVAKGTRPKIRPKNSSAISWYFEDLGAPLINTLWSWGAISSKKQDVFLRVWKDEIKNENGTQFVRLTLHSKFKGKKNPGYEERLRHLENIKNRSSGFAIICEAVDIEKIPRKIKSYYREKLFPILKIVEINGDDWGELGPGKMLSEYLS